MHPALSVVFFTALSGSGYGLLLVVGLLLAIEPGTLSRFEALTLLAFGALLATIGLFASLVHLGQPQRAWRALSQWRSSWLSREGVAALFTYLPLAACAALLWLGWPGAALRISALLLGLAALVTVYCTARIYTSLIPIPAWRHRLVLPGYLLFALLGGLLWLAPLRAVQGAALDPALIALLVLLALAGALLKWAYWRAIDSSPLGVDLMSATGLSGAEGMRAFEAPHTEANYLLREMGFVLARRHAARLRTLVLLLLGTTALLLAITALVNGSTTAGLLLLSALVAGQFAILAERWLFFAQARHMVTVYYGSTGAARRGGITTATAA
jgi:sulfite dehydrogenase (quinone) subunit SoeC